MPRKGYIALTIEDETLNRLDKVMQAEQCRTRPEVLRLLIRRYEKQEEKRNAVTGLESGTLSNTLLIDFIDNNKKKVVL